ncbi:MAG TPA: VanZ family protein [Gemmatimonadaceae bacterium]|nr:VanZ family protein [Gemmatimonadaceae bacterium]
MLRHLIYPFLPYRSLLYPIVVLSAIVLPCWLVFRLYRRRGLGHRPSIGREVLLLIFVVYLSGLAAVTLVPSRTSRAVAEASPGIDLRPSLASLTCSSPSMPAGSPARGFCMRNARGNALLFFPLGVLILLVWPRLRFWRGLQIAIALSLGIEILQYFSRALGSQRTADINDFILNVVGASVGLAIVSLLRWRPGARPAVQSA